MAGDYTISDLYQGGYSSLKPYGDVFTGYKASIEKVGVSTDPRTANILKEVSDKIAPGQKVVELSLGIFPDVPIEAIPKQYLREVSRLSKLTGVDMTVHGPLIEPSGLGKEGFSEMNRDIAERKIVQAVERSHEADSKGNIPVTFHSSVELPGPEVVMTKEGEEVRKLIVINQETGQMGVVKKEKKFYPGMREMKDGKVSKVPFEKGIEYGVEEQVRIMNHSEWDDSLTKIITPKEMVDRIIEETHPIVNQISRKVASGEIDPRHLTPTQREVFSRFENAHEQLKDIRMNLSSLFNKAYKYGSDEEKKYLKKVADEFDRNLHAKDPYTGKEILNQDIKAHSVAIQHLMEGLRPLEPQIFKPVEEFAFDKTTTTFGNAAWNSFKKFGDKAPIISIENPPAGGGFSRGEDLKNIVEESRKKFVEKAMHEGMSRKDAEFQAEKLIGVTWDVGHINQLRRFGFAGKDIVKEAGKVAPLLKHIHLSDNFGLDNVELPMGMGNVDLKEVMKKLGEKGEKAKKIVEAAHWWQHMRTSPVGISFEALGSPMYSTGRGPYWNEAVGLQQGYFSGYGSMLPPVNYETFGAGFSTLPMELGGQRAGAGGGRMSGRPME